MTVEETRWINILESSQPRGAPMQEVELKPLLNRYPMIPKCKARGGYSNIPALGDP